MISAFALNELGPWELYRHHFYIFSFLGSFLSVSTASNINVFLYFFLYFLLYWTYIGSELCDMYKVLELYGPKSIYELYWSWIVKLK